MLLQTPQLTFHDEQYNRFPNRTRRGMRPTFQGVILWHLTVICYYLCHSSCTGEPSDGQSSKDLVDLSHEFNSETIYYGTAKPLTLKITHNGTAANGNYWYQSEEFAAATHGGTHLDAPCHFAQGRWCVSDIPVSNLVASAVVIDISDEVRDDPTVHLKANHLEAWESLHGKIPERSVVLLRTGWSKFWPDKQRYSGTAGTDPNEMNYPSVEPEAAQWLVDNRNIVGFGIDTLSVDIARSPDKRTHRILEDKNIYGIENINDELKHLPPTGATIYVMPMKLKDASGAPCRVVAKLRESVSNGVVACESRSCVTIVTLVTLCGIYFIWVKSLL